MKPVSFTLMAVLATAPALAFDIEAHRGGRALFPENTLPAFANALAMGVDTLELDTGVTKDGVVIVAHERGLSPDLARGADGVYATAETPFVALPLAAVKTYDVGRIREGGDYARNFADQRAVPGTRIPTLSEVFALVRKSGNTRVRLNIETKLDPRFPDQTLDPERFAGALLDVIQTEGFADRVTIQSFDWRTLQVAQKRAPKIPTVYLSQQAGAEPTVALDRATAWTAGFNPVAHGGSVPKAVKAAGGAIWSPLFVDLTAPALKEAHDLGLKVVVWTVNRPEDMTRLIDMGVDGIISDRPDLLREAAKSKGLALPMGTPVAP